MIVKLLHQQIATDVTLVIQPAVFLVITLTVVILSILAPLFVETLEVDHVAAQPIITLILQAATVFHAQHLK
jgi:hypothetical protein